MRMITKKSSFEEDEVLIHALLTNLKRSHREFRRFVVDSGTHGQQCGLPIRGKASLNEYKKAEKRYKYNYKKAIKKYSNPYSLIASWREDRENKKEGELK